MLSDRREPHEGREPGEPLRVAYSHVPILQQRSNNVGERVCHTPEAKRIPYKVGQMVSHLHRVPRPLKT